MKKFVALSSVLALVCVAWVARSFAEDQHGSAAVVGAKAPSFTLQDQNGKDITLSDFDGKIVVLEWTNPHCPFVKRHYAAKTMVNLADQYKDRNVAWLAINSTQGITNADNKEWVDSQAIPYPVLNDAGGNVGKEYHATNTPEMFVIGFDGALKYKGAIDNDPYGDKSTGKINYVSQALDEILGGKPVSTPETKPYGCSVKYSD
jgi:peroxiredoxin